ncbi:hypothetical protein IFT48_05175 [Pseudomonas fluorescens]|uniref:hypothetical protein n=1 Tax=Pseudomonas fluorescens TaxID=294 RepID=UPI001930C8BE|nr:hypothetical protein [Pseudomonas fluorescens]MBD8089368.1 hypothetical protein [Pseudomonas fluorescens]
MGKSINMSLNKADKAILGHCCEIMYQASLGNPVPFLDLMRESKGVITQNHSQTDLVNAMGAVALYIRSQVMSPAKRRVEAAGHIERTNLIQKGLTNIDEMQAHYLKDATEVYMRAWMGQYDTLNSSTLTGGFNSLSNNDVWESVLSLRLDGPGVRNPLIPEHVRTAYKLNNALAEVTKAFRNERVDSSHDFE